MSIKSSSSFLNGQFRNKVIAGNFDFWQRGTSLSSSGYIADRWRNTVSGSTFTTSQQSFPLGQTDVPGNPTYFHRTIVTSANSTGNYFLLSQHIEGAQTFAGRVVTLSYWMRCDSPKTVAISLKQNFGSGGSTAVFSNIALFNIGTTWQRNTAQFTLPSISGKIFGTDPNLELQFYFDAGTSYPTLCGNQSGTFDLSRVQLEEGYSASSFEDRFYGAELALCQRYFEKSYNLATPPGTATATGCYPAIAYTTQIVVPIVVYKVSKRTSVSATAYGRVGGINKLSLFSSSTDVAGVFTLIGYENALYYGTNDTANLTAGTAYRFHWVCDAEFY